VLVRLGSTLQSIPYMAGCPCASSGICGMEETRGSLMGICGMKETRGSLMVSNALHMT
jgi:hypothetical protein